jgi:hypothetical protein
LGGCPAERSATVRDFPWEADHDFLLAMDEALVLSGALAVPDVRQQRQEPQPLDALQKATQVDPRRVDARRVACPMARAVESVDPVRASGEAVGSQAQSSRE